MREELEERSNYSIACVNEATIQEGTQVSRVHMINTCMERERNVEDCLIAHNYLSRIFVLDL